VKRTLAAFLAATLFAGPLAAQPAPARAPAQAAGPRELTPQELEVLKDVEDVVGRYGQAEADHRAAMQDLLRREYERRLVDIGERYSKGIAASEKDFRARHQSAEELLLAFLAKYPNDPKWTPDAMFRLADLYLDQAKWEFDEKEALAQDTPTPNLPDADDFDAPPVYIGPAYDKSLGIWRDILTRFPEYRQVDGVVYLMAYYLGEMQRTDEAKQAYLGLVCRNKHDPLAKPPAKPDPASLRSRMNVAPIVAGDPYEGCKPMKESPDLVDEAWVRIGEAHFDSRGELAAAIAAYNRVARRPESKFYDIALYKLAWSYYRNDRFLDGIKAFDELVTFSDKQEDAGGQRNDLRPEAVQYIAISFADPWEASSIADPAKSIARADAFYGNRTERHVRDVYEQLGDTLRLSAGMPSGGEVPPEIKAAYTSAIKAWRHTLQTWPLHPRNPIVHQKMVDALAFMGDQEGAAAERRGLADAYRRGGKWYVANETNREAMEAAQRLGEGSLIEAARQTHRAAQLAKQEWANTQTSAAKEKYINLYGEAARLYRAYLDEFPNSNEVYELTYRLADCLFFSEQYEASTAPYRWVRDRTELGTKYRDAAADSIVQAWEEAVKQAKQRGQLVDPPVPSAETLAQNSNPQPVVPLYQSLQKAYDEYAQIMVTDKTASTKALASAMISYRYVQLDDAKTRFDGILTKFCKSPEAVQAKEGLLAIYQSRGQNEKFKETADRFIASACGTGAADQQLAAEQKVSNEYTIAVKLFRDGKFEQAGDAFYGLYKGAQGFKDRAGALFNSALAYEQAGKPKTAIALYQEFTRVQEFRESEYYVESLFRSAVSYQNAFDYQTAVDTFLKVSDEAAKPGRKSRPEFGLAEARLNALYNAAFLRDLDRAYYDRSKTDPGAATLYRRYADAELRAPAPNRQRASEAYFNAGLVYEKAGATKDMIKAFADWRKLFAGDPGAGFYSVLADYKIAKALEKGRDRPGAEQYFRSAIRAFDASGEKPGSPSAELAAEAQFWLAEKVYKGSFEPYKVKWKGNIASPNASRAEKAVLDTLGALKAVVNETSTGYLAVARFEASWSLAAIVRLGDIYFFSGQKLIEAPVPKEIERGGPELFDAYQAQMEEIVQPQADAARDQWLKAVQTAKNAGVANEWSKLAQTRLNAYIAQDLYPVQRDEIIEKEQNP
jgi:cellulose synthase operon protein C